MTALICRATHAARVVHISRGKEAEESDSYANDRAIDDGSGSREDGLYRESEQR